MSLRGLRVQLLLWTILPVALLLVMLAGAGIFSHRQAMRDLVEERDHSLVLVEAGRLSRQVDALKATVANLAGEPGFHGDAALAVETAVAGNEDLGLPAPGHLVLLDSSGRVLYAPAGSDTWRSLPAIQQLLTDAQKAGTLLLREVTPPGQLPLLVILAPVPSAQPGQAGRWLLVAFPIESLDLASTSEVVQAGQRGVTYLLSANGTILHHANPAGLDLPPPSLDKLPAVAPDGMAIGRVRSSGSQLVVTYAQVAPLSWTLVLEEPLEDLIPPLLRSGEALPLVLLFVAVVTLLVLYFGVRWVVWPLQELDRLASRVAWGDFDAVKEPVGGIQEIEDLRLTMGQMADRLRAFQVGMRDYLVGITSAQEEERRRLARELHDDTTQSLIGLRQRVELLEKAIARQPERIPERLAGLRELIDETLAGLRRYTRNLRPLYLEDLGFIPALEAMAQDIEASHGLHVSVDVLGDPHRLPPDLELVAFRIAQEGLSNVVQHAQATATALAIEFQADDLILRLEDDGVGFIAPEQPHELAATGHFGLMGMRERVLLYGGRLSIKSAPGQGTTLIAWLPFPATEKSSRPLNS